MLCFWRNCGVVLTSECKLEDCRFDSHCPSRRSFFLWFPCSDYNTKRGVELCHLTRYDPNLAVRGKRSTFQVNYLNPSWYIQNMAARSYKRNFYYTFSLLSFIIKHALPSWNRSESGERNHYFLSACEQKLCGEIQCLILSRSHPGNSVIMSIKTTKLPFF